jgi:hypothetical protein
MRTVSALLLVSTFSMIGCSEPREDASAASNDQLTESAAEQLQNYAHSAAWSSSCDGAPVTQADLSAMLGSGSERTLGRFQIAMRDTCSPWTNGARSCGPSGESREAWTGDAKFGFGLDPNHTPSMAAWQFFRGPLFVHDGGDVLARRVGDRVVVQLVGDLSSVEIGTRRESDGSVTGGATLSGRLLSSDLVRDASVGGVLRAAIGTAGAKLEAADIDVDRLRYTSAPAGLADLALAKEAYGSESWGTSTTRNVTGNMTTSCLRLTDGMNPTATVVTATFAQQAE